MITFPELGVATRLGNHLFQIAATITLAMDNGDLYGFPRWDHEKDFPLLGCFHDRLPGGPDYKEPAFSYSRIPYSPGLRLHGYFQSEKYFKHREADIRKLFTPLAMPDRERFKETASLQVRRGGYLSLPNYHPILPMDYYERATKYLMGQGIRKILVFSDDLPWCREHFREPRYEVIPEMTAIQQFAWTISCRHHVMANSTFSWWSAWLNPAPDKIVIAPKLWFGPGYAHYDTRDLLPPEWVVM